MSTSKRGRDDDDDERHIIYKAYTARRTRAPIGCCEDHWIASSKYFAHKEDAEVYMMGQIVAHFAALEDISWFHAHGIEQVEDTYVAYCNVMDCWMRENEGYDYCIEEIELH
jgi:hypothetical protein